MSDSGYIYAIGGAGLQAVKIGKTAGPVTKRLAALQIGQPEPLTLLAHVHVERDLSLIEKAIHRLLAAERQRGEWFAIGLDQDQLEALIARAVQWITEEQARQELAAIRRIHAALPATSETLDVLIGRRIRQARERLGWNQSELARQLKKPRQHLSQIEQGKQQPRAELLVELAAVLGVTTDFLLGHEDEDSEILPREPALV